MAVALRQRQRKRPAGFLHQTADHAELCIHIRCVEIGDQFDHAGTGIGQPLRNAHQLRLRRAQARRRVALHRAVIERARGGKADRTGTHRLRAQGAHFSDVLFRRRFQARATFAHHINTQRAMGKLRTDIDVMRTRRHRIEIVRKTVPCPAQAFVQGNTGNVFHPFHQFDQAVLIGGAHRCEADAAIAHDDRGHTMPA